MTSLARRRRGLGPRTLPQSSIATAMETGTRMIVQMRNGVPSSRIKFSYPGCKPPGTLVPGALSNGKGRRGTKDRLPANLWET